MEIIRNRNIIYREFSSFFHFGRGKIDAGLDTRPGAFVMFFLYDWNRVFAKKRWMAPLFAAGNVCLAVVGVRLVWSLLSGTGTGRSGGEPGRIALCLALSLCNLLYAWYQERFIFIREFTDYADYRGTVPFLLPKRKGEVKKGDI